MGSHLLPRLCHTCLPVWKWLSCRHWMRLTDHIYLSGVYWAHRAPRIKPWTRAQKQICIEAANLLHRPRLIVWTPKVKTGLHSCFPYTVLCVCVRASVCARGWARRQYKTAPHCCFACSLCPVIHNMKQISKALEKCICMFYIETETIRMDAATEIEIYPCCLKVQRFWAAMQIKWDFTFQ